VAVYYDKPATAARWLAAAFGFETPNRLPAEDADQDWDAEHTWIEFLVGHCSLMIFKLEGERPEGAADTHTCPGCSSMISTPISPARRRPVPTSWRASTSTGTARTVPTTSKGTRWTIAQARPSMR
jgi:hypothetical protein